MENFKLGLFTERFSHAASLHDGACQHIFKIYSKGDVVFDQDKIKSLVESKAPLRIFVEMGNETQSKPTKTKVEKENESHKPGKG